MILNNTISLKTNAVCIYIGFITLRKKVFFVCFFMLLSTFYWSNGSQEYNKLHFKMQSLANLPNVMYIIYLK